MNQKNRPENFIAGNPGARRNYSIEEELEAGLVLKGWETKSLRRKRINLKEAYAYVKDGEAWLIGVHISPLLSCGQPSEAEARRTRKLLLNKREIASLMKARQQKGLTVVALSVYWKKNRVKIKLGLGRGKKMHDKRSDEKKRDWLIEKQRILKKRSR